MKTYTWAWADDEGNYINKADSLLEILETVLDYYATAYEHLAINERDGKFAISITTYEGRVDYEIEADPCDVCDFLKEQARLVDRPDRFDICVESS